MKLKLPPICRHPITRWIAIAIAIVVASSSANARTVGSLEFEACTLAPDFGIATAEAQCASLDVPEDHAKPDGRKITLAIAMIPGDAREEHPDPVFMLAGGPGQSARDGYPSIAPAFRQTNRLRDVILVDQRGTGASNPLQCDSGDEDEGDASESDLANADRDALMAKSIQQVRDCLATLKDSDPRFFTTTDAIADLDDVRRAIGADKINLVGISYGTRVAQQYAGRYPEHTRTVVLDGPVPNELMLGQDHARNLESALTLQLARCGEDSACSERFGDPGEKLSQLKTALREAPMEVTWRDPLSGVRETGALSYDDLAGLVRMYAYIPAAASMLPLVISETLDGRPDVLRAQAQMLRGQMEGQFSRGMELSVMCSEDVDNLHVDPADADTLIGSDLIEVAKAHCSVWPHGQMPADFHKPLTTDIPVLILAGEFDPVTPPRYGEQILKTLTNGRLLTLKGQGHNVMPIGCMPRVMADFIDSAKPADLDVDCLDDIPYTPPFAGFYGWEP